MMRKRIFLIGVCFLTIIFILTLNVKYNVLAAEGYIHHDTPTQNNGTIEPYRFRGYDGQRITDAEEYFRNHKYKGKKGLSIKLISSKTLSSQNHNQTDLNRVYNSNHEDEIEGTCSLVAIATVVEYFGLAYSQIPEDIHQIYARVVYTAYNHGFKGSGTNPTKIDNILTDTFAYYGVPYKGNNDYFNKKETIVNQINVNRPVILSMNFQEPYGSHTVVVFGYKTYEIKYKTFFNITIKEKITMYQIHTGWSYGNAMLDSDNMPPVWNITKIIPK